MNPSPRLGFGTRLIIAFKSFFKTLGNSTFAGAVSSVMSESAIGPSFVNPTPAPEATRKTIEVSRTALDPLQLLTILQREGRLVDFLMEDLTGIPDAQIGGAAREVHVKCRKALDDHVTLEAVVETPEEASMTVASGYDPSAIRVVGNLGANPPYTGTVRHRGWRAKDIRLQPLPAGQNPKIVAPAEIEVN